MVEFIVESYAARGDRAVAERGAERARWAAGQLTQEGTPVRFLRAIFVPEDETCFYLYEAASADLVREAARRAGLPYDRMSEAVSESRGDR